MFDPTLIDVIKRYIWFITLVNNIFSSNIFEFLIKLEFQIQLSFICQGDKVRYKNKDIVVGIFRNEMKFLRGKDKLRSPLSFTLLVCILLRKKIQMDLDNKWLNKGY